MVVDVAEPNGLASLGVSVDGGLAVLDGLQDSERVSQEQEQEQEWHLETLGLAISSIDHIKVHVELGGDSRANQSLAQGQSANMTADRKTLKKFMAGSLRGPRAPRKSRSKFDTEMRTLRNEGQSSWRKQRNECRTPCCRETRVPRF